jgi:hypothetical protein
LNLPNPIVVGRPLLLLAEPDSLVANVPFGLWLELTPELQTTIAAGCPLRLEPVATLLLPADSSEPLVVIDSLGLLDILGMDPFVGFG